MKFSQKVLIICLAIVLAVPCVQLPAKAASTPCNGSGPDLHGQAITDEVIQRYGTKVNDGWNNLWTINLSNANLSGATLATTWTIIIKSANFSCANLAGAVIGPITGNQPNFEYADLSNAQLSGIGGNANFKFANLSGASFDFKGSGGSGDFTGANLTNTRFFNSYYNNNDYVGVSGKFINTDLRSISVPNPSKFSLYGDFTGANLSGMQFGSLRGNFTRANLSNAIVGTLSGAADFTSANLQSATFQGTRGCLIPHSPTSLKNYRDEWWKLTFTAANLDKVDLTKLTCASGNRALDAKYSLATVEAKSLVGTPILPSGYKIVNGNLFGPGVQISDVDLGSSDLSDVDLSGVIGKNIRGNPILPAEWKLISGNLIGPGATLLNQDFAGADLSKLNLRNIRSYGVTGIAKLPTGYKLLGGTIFGPGVDLSGYSFNEPDSRGMSACLSFANLNLSEADMSYTSGSQEYYCGDNTYSRLDFSNSNLSRVNLKGAWLPSDTDFSGTNLSYVDFTQSSIPTGERQAYTHCLVRFNGANFTGANLAGFDLSVDYGLEKLSANFTLANLSGTSFQNLNYSDSNFTRANLSNANLSNANLSNANLSNANLSNANLQGVNLDQATLTGVKSGLIQGQPINLDPSWSQLGGYLVGPTANLSHADLSNTSLASLDLRGTRLNYSDLSGSDLSNTNLLGANLNFANLISANLQSANLAQAHMDYADLDSANLSGANLTSAIMFGTNLSNAMFASTTVPSAFKGQGSGLRKGPLMAKKPMRTIPAANLTNANISNSDIRKANFSGANLVGATFYKSNTSLAKFTGSIWGNTVCADGSTSNQRRGATCLGALLITTKFPQTKVLLPVSLKKSSVVNLPAVTLQNQPVILRSSGGCTVTGVYSSINGKRILSYYKLTAKKTTGSCTVTASATANTYYTNLLQSQVVTITN